MLNFSIATFLLYRGILMRLSGLDRSEITWLIIVALNRLKNHSIADETFYLKSFRCNSIELSVGLETWRKLWHKDGAHSGHFREFATQRLIQSKRTRKQNCRAFQKLSIVIHFVQISLKIQPLIPTGSKSCSRIRKVNESVVTWGNDCIVSTCFAWSRRLRIQLFHFPFHTGRCWPREI